MLERADIIIFQAHSKAVAVKSRAITMLSSNQIGKAKQISMFPPPFSAASSTSIKFRAEREVSSPMSRNYKQPVSELKPGIMASDQSIPSNSANGSPRRKKRCRLCKQTSMQKLVSTNLIDDPAEQKQMPKDDLNSLDQAQRYLSQSLRKSLTVQGQEPKTSLNTIKNDSILVEKPIHKFQRAFRNARCVFCLTRSATFGTVKPHLGSCNSCKAEQKKVTNLNGSSKEVDDVIGRIESLIISLQLLLPKPVHSPNLGNANDIGVVDGASPIPDTDSISSLKRAKDDVSRSQLLKASDMPAPLGLSVDLNINFPRYAKRNETVTRKESKPSLETEKLLNKSMAEFSKLISATNEPITGTHESVDGSAASLQRRSGSVESSESQRIQIPGQKVKALVERIESMNWIPGQDISEAGQTPENIQGLTVLPRQADADSQNQNRTASENEPVNGAKLRRMAPVPTLGSSIQGHHGRSRAIDLEHKHSQAHNKRRIVAGRNRTRSLEQIKGDYSQHTSPAFFVQQRNIEDRKARMQRNTNGALQSKKHPQDWPSEETSWDSASSSSWSSVQSDTHTSSSGLAQSEASGRGLSHLSSSGYDSSSYTGQNEETDVSNSGYDACSYTSQSEEYEVSSRGLSHLSSSACDASSYSGQSHSWDVAPSKRVCPRKFHKSERPLNPDRRVGRFRRLKNKLGMIFHHHHHHHHHHYNGSGDEFEAKHANSLWKQLGKMFHHTRKRENEKPKTEKPRKSVTETRNRKKHHGHFQTLVGGLVRHVRRTKKSGQAKDRMVRLGKGPRHLKKATKKLNWWQKLHRRRRVKVSNKAPVKLGGRRTKKPQVAAAKMLLRQ